MATLFRAMVMLSVLVGLPAAWVYYGPLPPRAQRTVDELVERGKLAVGWAQGESPAEQATFDPTQHGLASVETLEEAPPFAATKFETPSRDAGNPLHASPSVASTGLESAALEATPEAAEAAPNTNLDEQVEALLAELRELGAAEYALESWGSAGELYRFRCEMPLAATASLTRQFEAVATAPQESIAQVVAEVSSWRSRR